MHCRWQVVKAAPGRPWFWQIDDFTCTSGEPANASLESLGTVGTALPSLLRRTDLRRERTNASPVPEANSSRFGLVSVTSLTHLAHAPALSRRGVRHGEHPI